MAYLARAVERAMKIQEVILRALSGQLTWLQAADILGRTSPTPSPSTTSEDSGLRGLLRRPGQRILPVAHGLDHCAQQGLEVLDVGPRAVQPDRMPEAWTLEVQLFHAIHELGPWHGRGVHQHRELAPLGEGPARDAVGEAKHRLDRLRPRRSTGGADRRLVAEGEPHRDPLPGDHVVHHDRAAHHRVATASAARATA